MPVILARPYPLARLRDARLAIGAATNRDLRPLQDLYKAARDALAELDPDEVADFRRDHPRAATTDAAATRAAIQVASVWEGVVSIGAGITDLRRFRGFAWMVAHLRYVGEISGPPEAALARYAGGASLPDTSPEDSALYATLPALCGLGPEFPEELPGPVPLPGDPVWGILGLPADGDYSGIDPLDGLAVAPEVLQANFAGLPAGWRDLVARCADRGLLVRVAEALDPA